MHNSNAPMARTTLHLVSYQSLDGCSGRAREWAAGANSEGMTGLRRFRRVVDSLVPVAGPRLVAVSLIQVKFEFVYRLVILGDLAHWVGTRTLIGKSTHDSGGVANQHDGLSRNCRFFAVVEFEHCGVWRKRRLELKSGEIRLRGNAIQFGVQNLRFSGEINLIGQSESGGALIEELLHILVFPPRFDDVVIGDDFSIALHDESGAEDVNLEMRPRTVYIELHHPFVVNQRLARGTNRYPNGAAGLRVEEFDDN